MALLVDDVDWPIRTERHMLRLATVEDADAAWRFRRVESVSRWLTRAPQALAVVIAPDSASYGVVAERVRSVPQNALHRVTAEVSSNAGWVALVAPARPRRPRSLGPAGGSR